MSKAADLAKISAKGGFHLLWGLIASTIISAVGAIFIANLLGADQYGLYSIVLTAPNLLIILRDWGVNSAMVRFTAQYRADNRADEIRSIIVSGLIFEIVMGLMLSFASFSLADFIAASVFSRPHIAGLIQIASFSIIASALITAATAVFTGFEKMVYNNVMTIAQSVIRTGLVMGLVILGLGTNGATIGFTVGSLAAGVIGVVLILIIYGKLPKSYSNKLEIRAYIGTMFSYCLPLSGAVILNGLLAHFYAFLLPIHYVTDNVAIGNYAIAQNFVVLITFFAVPITTMLFPAFSKLDAIKDKEIMKNIYQLSVKYASLLVVPVAALIMALAKPAVSTIFDSSYDSAPLFLSLLTVTYFYTAFGNLSSNNLLNSQGQTKLVLKIALLTAAFSFPMGYTLIMFYGVIGLIATSLTAGLPGVILGLYYINIKYHFTIDWLYSLKILFSSGVAAICTFVFIDVVSFANLTELIIGVGLFISIILPTMLLTKTLTIFDIKNLNMMTTGLGPVSKIIKLILTVLEKIIVLLKL